MNGRFCISVSSFHSAPSRFEISLLCIFGFSTAIFRRWPRLHTINAFIGRLMCDELWSMLLACDCFDEKVVIFRAASFDISKVFIASRNSRITSFECHLVSIHRSHHPRNIYFTVFIYYTVTISFKHRTIVPPEEFPSMRSLQTPNTIWFEKLCFDNKKAQNTFSSIWGKNETWSKWRFDGIGRYTTINNNSLINCANKCSTVSCKGFSSSFLLLPAPLFASTMMARRELVDKNEHAAKQCAGTMQDTFLLHRKEKAKRKTQPHTW